jgi:hypothetical protein
MGLAVHQQMWPEWRRGVSSEESDPLWNYPAVILYNVRNTPKRLSR